MKILLLEDHELNSKIFIRLFTAHGYKEITHCARGLDALRLIHEQPVDIVFIDFDLPDISGLLIGLSIAWEIARGALPPIKLVALTAQSDKATQEEARKAGFHAFLGKPVTREDLLQILAHFDDQVSKEASQ